MIQPEINDLQKIKQQGIFKTAPVSMEILSDIRTPIEVLKILKNVSSHCYLLGTLYISGLRSQSGDHLPKRSHEGRFSLL